MDKSGRARGYAVAVGAFVADSLKAYALYVAIVIVGMSLLMFVADSIGYLSYSDRPGAGWHGLHPRLSLRDATFVAEFALLTVYISAVMGAVPAVAILAVALRRFSLHRAVITAVLVPVAVVSTLWLYVVAGWYVGLAAWFVIVAAALSVLFSLAVSGPTGVRIGKLRLRAF
jgi:hypothetical protein